MLINDRQRRPDGPVADAVARGLNILGARNAELASRYMRHKLVPEQVIVRVLGDPAVCRRESAGQSVSEAITPSSRTHQDTAAVAADQAQADSKR